jgi:dehydrogenase/reductase SDR family member 12
LTTAAQTTSPSNSLLTAEERHEPLPSAAGRLLDRALDWTVLPGYSNLGYRLRRRLWSEDPPAGVLAGRSILVTGASSGIGEAASEALARLGATVHMLVRNPERGEAARERVAGRLSSSSHREAAGRLELELCDLSDLDRVEKFAVDFASRVPRLHGLLNNAGVLPTERAHSPQGHEITFATNVLGPFRLTGLLLDPLRAAAPSRVVFASSGGAYTARLRADDLELAAEEADGTSSYAHTKRIDLILARMWAERERGSGVSFASFHPGWADTPGLSTGMPRFYRLLRPLLRTPAEGADTAVWLLAGEAAERRPGALWHDRRPRGAHRVPWTRESEAERRLLWERLVELTGSEDALARTDPSTEDTENGGN